MDVNSSYKMSSADRKRMLLRLLPYIFIGAELLIIIVLSVKLSVLKKLYEKDEEYIAASASRVYEYYDEKDVIYMDDHTFGEIWLEAVKELPKSSYDHSRLKTDRDFRYYTDENGDCISKLGVDVSYFQEDIDWEQVKQSGIDYAMIRVGYRGYETGKLNKDERFDEYVSGASAAGLDVGVYFFSQAVSVEEALEEAEFVLDAIKDYDITYPVVYDWEVGESETARTLNVSPLTVTECTAAFCNRVAESRYIPMVYTNKRQALLKTDLSQLAGFDLWIAEYRDEPSFPYEFQMWQYASDAHVTGIHGDVDINISFVDYSQVRT